MSGLIIIEEETSNKLKGYTKHLEKLRDCYLDLIIKENDQDIKENYLVMAWAHNDVLDLFKISCVSNNILNINRYLRLLEEKVDSSVDLMLKSKEKIKNLHFSTAQTYSTSIDILTQQYFPELKYEVPALSSRLEIIRKSS